MFNADPRLVFACVTNSLLIASVNSLRYKQNTWNPTQLQTLNPTVHGMCHSLLKGLKPADPTHWLSSGIRFRGLWHLSKIQHNQIRLLYFIVFNSISVVYSQQTRLKRSLHTSCSHVTIRLILQKIIKSIIINTSWLWLLIFRISKDINLSFS